MSAIAQSPVIQSFHQPPTLSISRVQRVTGRILSGTVCAFFLFDGAAKLFKAAPSMQAMSRLGYPESTVALIGAVLLGSTILHLIPRTQIFGALMISAYLGGAVATNVRVSGPPFTILFPVLAGSLVWAGLFLQNRKLRALLA